MSLESPTLSLPAQLLPGTLLDERFRIESRLGGGAAASVYLATQVAVGRPVAVKVLDADILCGPLLERFRREGRLLGQLSDPHVVTLFDACETDRRYLVMEYVEGPTIAEFVPSDGLPLDTALRLLDQLVSGVAAVHRRGLIHRDIKPENVIIGQAVDRPHVKLLDFGLARSLAEPVGGETRSGLVMGTPGYIAPEQIEDPARADDRADIYALGALLYFCTTGQRAYAGGEASGMIARQLTRGPDVLPLLTRELPSALADLIQRCMAADPERRPQCVDELREELRFTSSVSCPSAYQADGDPGGRPVTITSAMELPGDLLDLELAASAEEVEAEASRLRSPTCRELTHEGNLAQVRAQVSGAAELSAIDRQLAMPLLAGAALLLAVLLAVSPYWLPQLRQLGLQARMAFGM